MIMTIFGFFRTNHSVESSLHQNKTLRYFRLMSSALVSKNKKQVLHEVSVEFPEAKEFIDQKLEEKRSKENKSIEKVIYLFF